MADPEGGIRMGQRVLALLGVVALTAACGGDAADEVVSVELASDGFTLGSQAWVAQ